MRVNKRQLGQMEPIAAGAVGQVYRLTSTGVAGFTQPLAYKEILPTVPEPARTTALRAMEQSVDLRLAMDPADRAELDRFSTWPLASVEDGGATVGVLMPLIPPDFFVTTRPKSGLSERKVFEFSYLSASDRYVANLGIDRSAADDSLVRLAFAAQLSYVLGLLHKYGVVYGDLSLKNVAIATNPPRLMLLDCDASAAVSDTGRHQLHSPFFTPPECAGGRQQDPQTDVYKLGLCIMRGLVTGAGVTQLMDPSALTAILDPAGVDLITRAVSPDRSRRPTAKELFGYFVDTVRAAAQPPVLHQVGLSRTVLMRGRDVVVTWSADNASRIRIVGPNGVLAELDPATHPPTYAFSPATSGPLTVEAVNRHGTVGVQAGFVELYDLPSFELKDARLPRPQIGGLAPVQIPAVLATLPARPIMTSAAHPPPRLTAPELTPLLAALHPAQWGDPGQAVVNATPRTSDLFHRAHQSGNERVNGAIADALSSALATINAAAGGPQAASPPPAPTSKAR